MKKIGSFMAMAGLFAIVLNFLDRVPTILAWIYNWGDTTAWVIKIALVVVGGVLYFMGNDENDEEVSATENETTKTTDSE